MLYVRIITIPWGSWVHERPASRRRSRARAAVEGAGPSSSSAPAGASTAAAPQPMYLLVQRLFRYMERSKRQIMRRLDRIDQMFVAQGLELPPLPESSGSDEETHEEEHTDLQTEDIPADEPAHMEAPPQTQESQPVPQPQPQPEPIGVPIPDPQD
nr:pleckstrin homology-like domain family A member 1 [Arachis hypogaea]